MSLSIRSNIASINAQRQLALQNSARDLTVQRTSSGNRINSAKDDAAGLAISSRLTAKVRGYTQAARNVNEAISYALTADAGLQSVSNNLQRIRQLTVQAGNSSISRTDREAISGEVSDLIAEVENAATTTLFNNKKVLDGSATNVNFQAGATANDTLSVSLRSARPTDIGQRTLDSNNAQGTVTISSAIAGTATNTFAGNGFAAQQLTISGGDSAVAVSGAGLNLAQHSTAKQVAAAINGASDRTGVVATASTTVTLSNFTHVGYAQFTLFGRNTGAVAVTANISDTSNLGSVANAINSRSGQTGITATADRSGNLVLTESSGNDIGIKNQGQAGQGLDGVSFRGADETVGGATVAGASVTLADASGINAAQAGGKVSLTGSADYVLASTAAGSLFAAASNSSVFSSLAKVDLSTTAGATQAIKTIDAAIDSVDKSLASVGSLQVRLDKVISQLQDQTGAADAARSRISDTDYANETARLTRAAILQNAATTVMTQANAQARNVLTLLRF